MQQRAQIQLWEYYRKMYQTFCKKALIIKKIRTCSFLLRPTLHLFEAALFKSRILLYCLSSSDKSFEEFELSYSSTWAYSGAVGGRPRGLLKILRKKSIKLLFRLKKSYYFRLIKVSFKTDPIIQLILKIHNLCQWHENISTLTI